MPRKITAGYWVRGQFVAAGSELDAELNATDGPSKSDLKRESAELQQLGVALLGLRADALARLQLPERLLEALADARRITAHEGRRRQLQYIGKLMRGIDPAPVRALIAAESAGSAQDTLALHQAEQWRDALIADDAALGRWLEAHPGTDTQALRALIRQARKDAQSAPPDLPGAAPRHGRAYREIFQTLKAQLSAATE